MRTFAVLVWISQLSLLHGQTSDKSTSKSLRSSGVVFVPRSRSNNLTPYYPDTKSTSQSKLPVVGEIDSKSTGDPRSVRKVSFSDPVSSSIATGSQSLASASGTKSQSAPKSKVAVDEATTRSASADKSKSKSTTTSSSSTSSSKIKRSIGIDGSRSSSKSFRSTSQEFGSASNPLANFIHDPASGTRSSRSRIAESNSYSQTPSEVFDGVQFEESVTIPQSVTASHRGSSTTAKSFSLEQKISELYGEFSKARSRCALDSASKKGQREPESSEASDVSNVRLTRLLAARMGQLAGDEDVKKAADLLARMAGTAGTAAAFEFARQMENRQGGQRTPCTSY